LGDWAFTAEMPDPKTIMAASTPPIISRCRVELFIAVSPM